MSGRRENRAYCSGMDLAGLASCRELTAEHAEAAGRSAELFRAVIARAAEISQPEDGAPMILFDVLTDQGWGIRERIAPRARFAAPLDEFTRAVEISSKRFAPLRATITAEKVVLSGAETSGASEVAAIPTPIEPEPFSVPGTPRRAAPPKPAADPVHSRPTVRRMVAIKPEALRTGRKDPRREDDE